MEPAEPDPDPINRAEAEKPLAEARRAAAAAAHLPALPFCYVLYTSGSTGAPKDVCGTEAGVAPNLFENILFLDVRATLPYNESHQYL